MSSAKKCTQKAVSCWHVSSFLCTFFHRAKPVSEMERSGIERHCGVAAANTVVPTQAKMPPSGVEPSLPPKQRHRSQRRRAVPPTQAKTPLPAASSRPSHPSKDTAPSGVEPSLPPKQRHRSQRRRAVPPIQAKTPLPAASSHHSKKTQTKGSGAYPQAPRQDKTS